MRTVVGMMVKKGRRMLVKLRGGTAELPEMEAGRGRGLRREERICRKCS